MAAVKNYDTWLKEVFETTCFNDETKRLRHEQQTLTGFFMGGKMAVDDTEHSLTNAMENLSGRRLHGFFKSRDTAGSDVAPQSEQVNKKQFGNK